MEKHKITANEKSEFISVLEDLQELALIVGMSQNFQFLMAGVIEAAMIEFSEPPKYKLPVCFAMGEEEFQDFMVNHISEIPFPANNFQKHIGQR